jgi:hypothetical protein
MKTRTRPGFLLLRQPAAPIPFRGISTMQTPTHEEAIASTREWLEKAVIGLNLCPFAKSVYVKNQVRIVVSDATEPAQLAEELARELRLLAETSPEETDTTLLIHPYVLQRFLDFNEFQDIADAIVEELELDGVCR